MISFLVQKSFDGLFDDFGLRNSFFKAFFLEGDDKLLFDSDGDSAVCFVVVAVFHGCGGPGFALRLVS